MRNIATAFSITCRSKFSKWFFGEYIMAVTKDICKKPSEYIRDLIRRDMERRAYPEQQAILDGYRDLASGAVFTSSGDFDQDMKTLSKL